MVEWEWGYAVGDTRARFPLPFSGADDVVRDPAQERALLDTLDLPAFADVLLRVDGPGSPLQPRVRLDALDTMRFSTEVLPLLADAPGVVVEVGGSPATYRETGDLVQVGVSTTESDEGTDWFDLGVRISVEGRDVPFSEVFAALAAGETHLLLPDGAVLLPAQAGAPGPAHAHRGGTACCRTRRRPRCGSAGSRWACGEGCAALGVVDAQARAWQQQVAGLLAIRRSATALPAGFLASRAPPSVRASTGCASWRHGLGGVLADDMGLGKTVQTLALRSRHAREVEPAGNPFLIVRADEASSRTGRRRRRASAQGCGSSPSPTRCDGAARSCRRRSPAQTIVVTSYTLFPLDRGGSTAQRRGPGSSWTRRSSRNHQTRSTSRASAPRAVQARDHGDTDGEQPDGAAGHCYRSRHRGCSQPDPLPRDVRAAE